MAINKMKSGGEDCDHAAEGRLFICVQPSNSRARAIATLTLWFSYSSVMSASETTRFTFQPYLGAHDPALASERWACH